MSGFSRRRVAAALVVAAAASGVLAARPAHATSCAMPTPDNGDRYADVVFEAQAAAVVKPDVVRLAVSKVYKGGVPAVVVARHGGMKGYPAFDIGKRYLVYGVLSDGLFIHLCGATHVLPPKDMFAQGPWKGWTAEARYGAGKAPGTALASGKRPEPTPIPTTSASSAALPPPPAAPSSAAPRPAASPPAAPAPAAPAAPFAPAKPVNPQPIPKSGGSSAGCAFAAPAPASHALWFATLALCLARRRRD